MWPSAESPTTQKNLIVTDSVDSQKEPKSGCLKSHSKDAFAHRWLKTPFIGAECSVFLNGQQRYQQKTL
jgi:hypothetical protein